MNHLGADRDLTDVATRTYDSGTLLLEPGRDNSKPALTARLATRDHKRNVEPPLQRAQVVRIGPTGIKIIDEEVIARGAVHSANVAHYDQVWVCKPVW